MGASSAAPFTRYAVLSAAIVAVTAWVPGAPFYADEGSGSAEGAIIVTVLVLAGLLTRARLSWYVAAALDGIGLAVFASVFLLELRERLGRVQAARPDAARRPADRRPVLAGLRRLASAPSRRPGLTTVAAT